MCCIGLNDWDAAFQWMDTAVEMRDLIIMAIKTFPFLDPMRDDPSFRVLLQKMHL